MTSPRNDEYKNPDEGEWTQYSGGYPGAQPGSLGDASGAQGFPPAPGYPSGSGYPSNQGYPSGGGYPNNQGYGFGQAPGYGAVPAPGVQVAPMPAPVDAMLAISQGFKGMVNNVGPYLLAALAHGVVLGVFLGIFFLGMVSAGGFVGVSLDGVGASVGGAGLVMTMLLFVALILAFVYLLWMSANFMLASRKAAEGQIVTVADFFKGSETIPIVVVYLVNNIILAVGTVALFVPGIIAAVLLCAAPAIRAHYPQLPLLECLKRSYELVRDNLGQVIVFCILSYIVSRLILLVPFLGFLSFPFIALANTLFVRSMLRLPSAYWA